MMKSETRPRSRHGVRFRSLLTMNYILVLFSFLYCVFGTSAGYVVLPLFIVAQFALVLLGHKFASKVSSLVILDANLLASTVLGHLIMLGSSLIGNPEAIEYASSNRAALTEWWVYIGFGVAFLVLLSAVSIAVFRWSRKKLEKQFSGK